ncbi:MAG TPA: FtsX-like permease family protein [Flavobacterium sp.]
MNFPFYIAKRYLKSASKNNAINIINAIAALGIIVGAMALFIVLSVFSGLKDFSLSFSNEFDPDVKVITKVGKSFLITPQQHEQLQNYNGILAYSSVIEERVLFMFNEKEHVTYLKGVDSLFSNVNDVKKAIYQGQWVEPETSQVVVGHGISQKLSLGLFDFNNPFEVFVPKPGRGDIENPEDAFRKSALTPIGIYAINEELDSKYVFADLALTQELLDYAPNQISAIEVKLSPDADEQQVISKLNAIFDNKLSVRTRAQLNDSLYKMLNTENIAVYLIFTLVIIIALFNLIGALIMMILDKKSNLKTLFNLGTEIKDLRKIFLLQGTLLSVGGGIIGLILGIIVVLVQQRFQLIMITPTLAYPVVFSLQNVLIVLATISALGFVASLIASSRVSKGLLE